MKDTVFSARKYKIVFLHLRNEPASYLNSLTSDPIKNIKIEETAELSAIINSVISISFTPSYFGSKMRISPPDNSTYIQLNLPYYINSNIINKEIKGKWNLSKRDSASISLSTKMVIDSLLNYKFGLIQPPLARYLGKPAVNYMVKSIKSGNVFDELHKKLEL